MSTTQREVLDHSIEDHGVEHSQYFPGAGIAHTRWTACFTGIGTSAHEALEDALESAAQAEWDVSGIENDLDTRVTVPEPEGEEDEDGVWVDEPEELWHHVTLYLL